MTRNFMLCLTLIASISVAHAATNTVRSPGGTSISISGSGRLTQLQAGGRTLLAEKGFSGFVLEDVASGTKAQITGRVTREGDAIIVSGAGDTLQLRLFARIRVVGEHIAGNVIVQDTSGRDRAIRASLFLTLRDLGWTWCKDLDTGYVAKVGVRNVELGAYAGHEQSSYPFSAISTPDGAGLAIAWPMSNPRFYTQSFTRNADGTAELAISAALGISTDAKKSPGRADFDFLLYSFDGRDRFRGALAGYYEIYPECFEVRVKQQGIWTLWLTPGMEDYARRMGVAYHEAEFDLDSWDKIKRDKEYGFMSFQYSEPWAVWYPVPIGWKEKQPAVDYKPLSPFESVMPQKAISDLVAADVGSDKPSFRFPGMTRDQVARAMSNSAVWRDPDANWMVYNYQSRTFGWGEERKWWDQVSIIMNPDPDIPHPNRSDIAWDGQYMFADAKVKAQGAGINGLYVDTATFMMAWDQMNFRREHWAYADIPLTWTKLSDGRAVPAQALALADSEYLKSLHERGKRKSLPVLVNGWAPIYAVCAAFIDILGAGECSASTPEIDQSYFGYFRTMAYRKPVSIMDYSLSLYGLDATKENVEKHVEPRINHLLLYGIYPGTANCWSKENTARLDLVAPVYEKYIPIFRAINLAGWEPITRVSSDDSGLLIERWGRDPGKGLYLTIYNPSDRPSTSRIRVEPARSAKTPLSARELISGDSIALEINGRMCEFGITVPPKRTLAIRISAAAP